MKHFKSLPARARTGTAAALRLRDREWEKFWLVLCRPCQCGLCCPCGAKEIPEQVCFSVWGVCVCVFLMLERHQDTSSVPKPYRGPTLVTLRNKSLLFCCFFLCVYFSVTFFPIWCVIFLFFLVFFPLSFFFS